MHNDSKITLAQWNQLSAEGKETLRSWAMKEGIALDLVPGPSGTFDPVCDYAALLTKEQLRLFLKINKQEVTTPEDMNALWKQIKKYLS